MRESLNTRETLLSRLVDRHDEHSWSEFVHYYRQFIYLLIRRMNIDHHNAEELTQEILVKLWEKLPEFRYNPERGRFRSWLCRIVDNKVKNFVRDRKRYYEKLDSVKSGPELNTLQSVTLPEIDKIAREEWEKYISVMAWENIRQHYSDRVCRAFLMLRSGSSRKEVADELGLAETTVSTYKTRIIERIQAEIQRLDEQLSDI